MCPYHFKILKTVDEEWNKNLLNCGYSTFFQTREYFISNSLDHFPIFIYVLNEKEEIVGQLAIRIINTSVLYSSSFFKTILNLISKITRRAVWIYGPIIHSDNKNTRLEILQQILTAVERVSEQYDLVHVEGQTPPLDYMIDDDYIQKFEKNKYVKNASATYLCDLNRSIEEIWNDVSKKTKGDINRAKRRNLTPKILETTDELKEYLILNQEWAKSKGLVISEPFKNFDLMWKNHKVGIEKIFLTYENDKLISGVMVGFFNNIGYTNFVINSYTNVTNLGGTILTWYVLEWAKNAGLRIYDFSGGLTLNKEQEKNSLLFYKSKWGGKETPYYIFIKPRKKISYKLYLILFNVVRKYHYFLMKYCRFLKNLTIVKNLM